MLRDIFSSIQVLKPDGEEYPVRAYYLEGNILHHKYAEFPNISAPQVVTMSQH
jgi:hypothetical protein